MNVPQKSATGFQMSTANGYNGEKQNARFSRPLRLNHPLKKPMAAVFSLHSLALLGFEWPPQRTNSSSIRALDFALTQRP
jgi:hypothetical protein